MKVFIAILLLALLSPFTRESCAKCRYASHTISGAVLDESTKQAVSSATIYFFFDESETGFIGASDTNGVFMATSMFATDSGWLFFDRCNRKPKNLTVVIAAPGYLTKRVIFKRKDLNIDEEAYDQRIELPPIFLLPTKY